MAGLDPAICARALALPRHLIISADDFGLSQTVNEAIERAHRHGILAAASLVVAGPAAEDAIRRARALPSLRVGLHLVTIEGQATLPPGQIPDLVTPAGTFPSGQLRLGLRYITPRARRQLAAEIEAQFAAFAATALHLDHANAHKHMHLHPVVGRLLIETGRRYGLRALRVPAEPPQILAAAGTQPRLGDRALYHWTRLFRRQARRAGLLINDHCFGLTWSGQMDAPHLLRLVPHLPSGISEIYFHP
ncbi:MAG: hopanoid biosynthesis-associated protein HpnK, partial [Acetobacteraceae bacterium]|nr:hopanoid biosynthesis-associated protein HpnK [Acetobacteraceae bacterium]